MTSSPLAQPLMLSSSTDPFHAFKDLVQGRVSGVTTQLQRWQGLLTGVNTAEDSGFQQLTQELRVEIDDAEKDLRGIDKAVSTVEHNRGKFPHITDSELASRRAFVTSMKEQLAGAKSTMNSRQAQGKMDSDKRAMLAADRAAARSGGASRPESRYDAANSRFVDEEKGRGQVLLQEQDQHLDALDGQLSRLGEMATSINVELEEQVGIMTDLDEEVTEVQSRMDQAMGQIQKLLKTKDKCQLWTIFILILVLLATVIALATGA